MFTWTFRAGGGARGTYRIVSATLTTRRPMAGTRTVCRACGGIARSTAAPPSRLSRYSTACVCVLSTTATSSPLGVRAAVKLVERRRRREVLTEAAGGARTERVCADTHSAARDEAREVRHHVVRVAVLELLLVDVGEDRRVASASQWPTSGVQSWPPVVPMHVGPPVWSSSTFHSIHPSVPALRSPMMSTA